MTLEREILADVLAGMATDTIERLRAVQGGTYDRATGRVVPPAFERTACRAVVRPVSGDDIAILSEGTKLTDALAIYTALPLRTVTRKEPPDVFAIRGDYYEAKNVDDRTREGGFYKALVVRCAAPPETPQP